jgi:hypothetical protein
VADASAIYNRIGALLAAERPRLPAPPFSAELGRRWGQVCPETAGINAQGDTARFRQLELWMKLAATIHSGMRDAPPDPWHRSWGISS